MSDDGKQISEPAKPEYPAFKVFGIGGLVSLACFLYFFEGCNFFVHHTHEGNFNSSINAAWTGLKAVVACIVGLITLLIGLGAHHDFHAAQSLAIDEAIAATAAHQAHEREEAEKRRKRYEFEQESSLRELRHEEYITKLRKARVKEIETLQEELARYKAMPSEEPDEQD